MSIKDEYEKALEEKRLRDEKIQKENEYKAEWNRVCSVPHSYVEWPNAKQKEVIQFLASKLPFDNTIYWVKGPDKTAVITYNDYCKVNNPSDYHETEVGIMHLERYTNDNSNDYLIVFKNGCYSVFQGSYSIYPGYGHINEDGYYSWYTENGSWAKNSLIKMLADNGGQSRLLTKPDNTGGCYVATCVYGSYDCPEVWTLRRFRDYKLAESFAGRLFIKFYYAVSPTVVKVFGDTKPFKKIWKSVLDRMVKRLQHNGYESTPYEDRVYNR